MTERRWGRDRIGRGGGIEVQEEAEEKEEMKEEEKKERKKEKREEEEEEPESSVQRGSLFSAQVSA